MGRYHASLVPVRLSLPCLFQHARNMAICPRQLAMQYACCTTHLRFARTPILLLVVAVGELRVLIWERESALLAGNGGGEGMQRIPAQPVLKMRLSLVALVGQLRNPRTPSPSPDSTQNCTHQSSGSSSSCIAGPAFVFTASFGIFGIWCETLGACSGHPPE